jgi:hypothetical protein
VLDGVFHSEDASLGLGLVAHVTVLLTHAHHYALRGSKDTRFNVNPASRSSYGFHAAILCLNSRHRRKRKLRIT